jgi:hypothetical protein
VSSIMPYEELVMKMSMEHLQTPNWALFGSNEYMCGLKSSSRGHEPSHCA